MEDLISIIIPVYRVESFLDQAVQSVLSQTYKNLEVILVDDGSDDKCPHICDQYSQLDGRVKVIHKKNGGLDDARKAGISVATGKYVGYVDGDDWIEPEMLERLHYYMTKYHVKVVESGIIDTYENREFYRFPSFPQGTYSGEQFESEIEPRLLYCGTFFRLGIMASLCNKLYERTLITKYQMLPDPSDNIVDDTMVSIPCVAESKSVYITHECFYHYRVRSGSIKHSVRPDFVPKILSSYSDWISRFPFVKEKSNIEWQIRMYLMYLLIMKCPSVFDSEDSDLVLTAYGGILKDKKVIVYGAGAAGIQLAHYCANVFGKNFVLWADKNYESLNETMEVSNPQEILQTSYDYVLIGILWHEKVESAIDDLLAMGVPRGKILWIKPEYIKFPELLLDRLIVKNKKD